VKRGSQRQTVLTHLRRRSSISPMEALVSYGIYRLADVIYRLRELGYGIVTEMKTDEAGHKYAKYSIDYWFDGGKVPKA
jgi:hypothetical protein